MTDPVDQEQPFLTHLLELRDRVLRVVVAVVAIWVCLLPFANPIYSALAGPLTRHLPAGSSMIAIDPISPFLTPLMFTLVLAFYIAIPWVLFQLWAFVAPGLYKHEKKLALPMVISSTVLFYAGMAFAYFVILPLFFAFLTATAPAGVAVMTDIKLYLSFVLTLFLAFGFAFEVPIATILLVLTGVTTPEALAKKRPYVIVGAFVIGMLLTPPDMISQTLLAIPMWLLFEAGVLLARLMRRKVHTASVGQDAGHGS